MILSSVIYNNNHESPVEPYITSRDYPIQSCPYCAEQSRFTLAIIYSISETVIALSTLKLTKLSSRVCHAESPGLQMWDNPVI